MDLWHNFPHLLHRLRSLCQQNSPKATPNLTIVGAVGEKADKNTEMKRETLLKAGGYSRRELDKLDLTNMEDTEIQKRVRQKPLGAMANIGNHQKVAPINEVEDYLTKGVGVRRGPAYREGRAQASGLIL